LVKGKKKRDKNEMIAQARQNWKGISVSATILVIWFELGRCSWWGEYHNIYSSIQFYSSISSLCCQLVGLTCKNTPPIHPASELPDGLKIEFPTLNY
jgi:hypothetical protein